MWFIGVEVEQETSAPPPKQNPGSAPASPLSIPTGWKTFRCRNNVTGSTLKIWSLTWSANRTITFYTDQSRHVLNFCYTSGEPEQGAGSQTDLTGDRFFICGAGYRSIVAFRKIKSINSSAKSVPMNTYLQVFGYSWKEVAGMCTYINRLRDKQAYVRAYSFSICRQKNVGNKFGILRFKAESLTHKVRLIYWT